MLPKITACCFIRDTYTGAFCLWESMAQIIPLVDEYIVMDCGSTDGTLEELANLAELNPKIKIVHGNLLRTYADGRPDNRVFADLANELVMMAKNEIVFYHQADEIFHEDLIKILREMLDDSGVGLKEVSFLRYQLKNNFQEMKWYPHVVKRIGLKYNFRFTGDGMNAENYGDAPLIGGVSNQDFQTNYKGRETEIDTNKMILDVSMTGGFLENILMRRQLHAPIWNEDPNQLYGVAPNGQPVNTLEWIEEQRKSGTWNIPATPFNIPEIMRYHVGKQKYELRQSVFDTIANG